jgi:DNA polymerase-3 subunit chi
MSSTATLSIQFYHLLSSSRERAVPKLMEKALASGATVVMLAGSEAVLKRMSDALWSDDPASFLPHGDARSGHNADQPIYLTLTEENPNGAEILCVLDGTVPQTLAGYRKVLDVFDGSREEEVTAARTRWSAYKAQGHALQYVRQQPGGGWKVEMTSDAAAA